jgi:hypothetical protein
MNTGASSIAAMVEDEVAKSQHRLYVQASPAFAENPAGFDSNGCMPYSCGSQHPSCQLEFLLGGLAHAVRDAPDLQKSLLIK